MTETDFAHIAPRNGGKQNAFEELVCQLARRTVPQGDSFERLRGDGGDGGIECYSDDAEGRRTGWQAKYVFNIGKVLTQASDSLSTAIEVHPTLHRFVVAFPFDLTGPTKRKGRSQLEKWDAWKQEKQTHLQGIGRNVVIEKWTCSEMTSLLLQHDPTGGIREYFFNATLLTPEWFKKHIDRIILSAGPRYTQELNVETPLTQQLEAFGRTPVWSAEFQRRVTQCARSIQVTRDSAKVILARCTQDDYSGFFQRIQSHCDQFEIILKDTEKLLVNHDDILFDDFQSMICTQLTTASELLDYASSRKPAPDSELSIFGIVKVLRQHKGYLDEFNIWLRTPECFLTFKTNMLITGNAGAGKTHAVCDAAHRRLERSLPTCVLFGTDFSGSPDPLIRLTESLELAEVGGPDKALDALNAAAESAGTSLIIVLDAINETRPLSYWASNLSKIIYAVSQRKRLRLCITCRSSFENICLPPKFELPQVCHQGFHKNPREACAAFFKFYGLQPPVFPPLQPEFANPLYLKLVCETLQAQGKHHLPSSWFGMNSAISAFLNEHDNRFARETGAPSMQKHITLVLRLLASEMAEKSSSGIPLAEAHQLIAKKLPNAETDRIRTDDIHVGNMMAVGHHPFVFKHLRLSRFLRQTMRSTFLSVPGTNGLSLSPDVIRAPNRPAR